MSATRPADLPGGRRHLRVPALAHQSRDLGVVAALPGGGPADAGHRSGRSRSTCRRWIRAAGVRSTPSVPRANRSPSAIDIVDEDHSLQLALDGSRPTRGCASRLGDAARAWWRRIISSRRWPRATRVCWRSGDAPGAADRAAPSSDRRRPAGARARLAEHGRGVERVARHSRRLMSMNDSAPSSPACAAQSRAVVLALSCCCSSCS